MLQKGMDISKKVGDLLERRRWILPSLFSAIIFFVAIWGIGNFNQLLLYDDEFGYWMASAYLTGSDWKSVGSGIPYYSYGYGFLVLTPIRLLFSTPSVMYKAAIVANALLLVASYWIARNVSKQIFEKTNWILMDAVCFLVMLYPSNIVFSHIAWAECTLVFVFWVFVWLSLRVIQKPSLLNHIAIAFNVMLLYAVHQRTLAVAIATVMIMAWYFYTDKNKRKNILAFAITMLLLIVVHKLIKTDLIDNFYYNNAKVDRNNIEGQVGTLSKLFTGEGIGKLLTSIIGKSFYFLVATLTMAWWAVGFFQKTIHAYLKEAAMRFKKKRIVKPVPALSIWYLWIALAFLGTFMISAIFLLDVHRNDILVYGRYVEYMLGIYFIIGIEKFFEDEEWLSKTPWIVLLALCGAWFCQSVLDGYELTAYQAYHSIATSLFLEKGSAADGALWHFAVWGAVCSVGVMLICRAKPWKKADILRKLGVVCAIAGVFVYIAYGMVFGVMTDKQCLRIVNIQNIITWIDQVDEDRSENVYYCSDTESRYWSESFQFLLGETPLSVIRTDQIKSEEDAFYIVGNSFLSTDAFYDDYYCIKQTNQFSLVVRNDGELVKEAHKIKGE